MPIRFAGSKPSQPTKRLDAGQLARRDRPAIVDAATVRLSLRQERSAAFC